MSVISSVHSEQDNYAFSDDLYIEQGLSRMPSLQMRRMSRTSRLSLGSVDVKGQNSKVYISGISLVQYKRLS